MRVLSVLAFSTFIAFGAVLALACAGPPPVPPANEGAGLIAIKVVRDGLGGGLETHRGYFVRVEEGGDPLSRQVLIPSNYSGDGYVYLLNARPGRYAAVAAARLSTGGETQTATMPVGGGGGFSGSAGVSYTPGPTERITLLPGGAIQGTLVEVKTGSVAFMGEWKLNEPWFKKIGDDDDADAAQRHYFRMMEAQGIGTSYHRGSEPESDRSDAAWLAFLPHARKRLADTGWSRILENAAKAVSDSAVVSTATASLLSFTCKKPFVLERDCSSWSGPKRRIEARGVALKVAGSADGRTIALMKASLWESRFPLQGYPAVEAELRSHNIGIKRVTAISQFDKIHGYILELDGDGYSILEDLSK
jgi:hypothetical protein